ncbi:hypothetical protein VTO73DRAFT_4832 [Trametes versicolor]
MIVTNRSSMRQNVNSLLQGIQSGIAREHPHLYHNRTSLPVCVSVMYLPVHCPSTSTTSAPRSTQPLSTTS